MLNNDQYIDINSISKLIRFHDQDDALNELQATGVAALWNFMADNGFAYLADEVGMGKTWQAMGIIALQFMVKPRAHVLVICPGSDLQDKWHSNWITFVKKNYCSIDDIIKDKLEGNPVVKSNVHDRLRDYAEDLVLDIPGLHIMRYSSFSRPLWFGKLGKNPTIDEMKAYYRSCIRNLGFADLNEAEDIVFEKTYEKMVEQLSGELNKCYAQRVGYLVKAAKIDLIVYDEAQYLRYYNKNQRNKNIRFALPASSVERTLFMSATPHHRDENDVLALGNYLKRNTIQESYEKSGKDIITTMKGFMVRRMRYYQDSPGRKYSKHMYRSYDHFTIDGRNDPFYCLTLGAVQKKLVRELEGKNNQFRIGQCSSFESLKASIKKRTHTNRDGLPVEDPEFEKETSRSDLKECSPDRIFIDDLGQSYSKQMGPFLTSNNHNLPHAKLDEMVEMLVNRYIKNGSCDKSVVFVRRLDTVDEMISQLSIKYQKAIDERIGAWLKALKYPDGVENAADFWRQKDDQEDTDAESSVAENDADDYVEEDTIAYIDATRKTSSNGKNTFGKLFSFQSRLLRSSGKSRSPLLFFLTESDETQWLEFINTINSTGLLLNTHPDPFETKLLKRCLLQTMRRSDFLVDLYIMNRYIVTRDYPLGKVLVDFFKGSLRFKGREVKDIATLEEYRVNWCTRLRLWLQHFELIREHSLVGINEENLSQKLDPLFYHKTPIAGRSGRMKAEQTVPQFKLPGFPNIIVCTDVLREGIDLHLFCNSMHHYGVAWTSGDLEQRIGRIDRFSSMINRDIASFGGEVTQAPRLQIGFPSLAGTLDSLQVDRVRRRKAYSDLVIDFGETRNEDTEITTDSLYTHLREHSLKNQSGKLEPNFDYANRKFEKPIIPEHTIDPLLKQMAETIKSKIAKALCISISENVYSIHVPNTDDTITINYLPNIKVFRICYRQKHGRSLDHTWPIRWLYEYLNSKYLFFSEAELLLPTNIMPPDIDLIVREFFCTDNTGFGTGLSSATQVDGFHYDHILGSLCRDEIINNPCNHDEKRVQQIILEHYRTGYILKTIVATDEHGMITSFGDAKDAKKAKNLRGVDSAIIKLNEMTNIGYFTFQNKALFYAIPLMCIEALTTEVVCNMAIWADRIQLLLTASDDRNYEYRASRSLFEICQTITHKKIDSWNTRLHELTGDNPCKTR